MSRIWSKILVMGAGLALILAVAQALGARVPTAGVSYLPELERAIFHFTNEVRQKNGFSTLTWENCLRYVARAHSADMLVRNYFEHNSPEGRTPLRPYPGRMPVSHVLDGRKHLDGQRLPGRGCQAVGPHRRG